jgi:hypothetical protein
LAQKEPIGPSNPERKPRDQRKNRRRKVEAVENQRAEADDKRPRGKWVPPAEKLVTSIAHPLALNSIARTAQNVDVLRGSRRRVWENHSRTNERLRHGLMCRWDIRKVGTNIEQKSDARCC